MKKQILIRYKWSERGEEKWLFWLKKKLEDLSCDVLMLPIADVEFKGTSPWLSRVQATHAIAQENTYFVEHDPGCLTILKYVERLLKQDKEEPALLVAGFGIDRGERSSRTDIQMYRETQRAFREDVRLIVVYGGTLGKVIENEKKKLLTQGG